jgi:tetratricopeptide (TPR) repeat protein
MSRISPCLTALLGSAALFVAAERSTPVAFADGPPARYGPGEWYPEEARIQLELARRYERLAQAVGLEGIERGTGIDEATRNRYEREQRHWQERAEAEYRDLNEYLKGKDAANLFSSEERRQIRFGAAQLAFGLGKYDSALRTYRDIAEASTDREEKLKALGGMLRCQAVLGRPDDIRLTVAKIRPVLKELDDEKRQQWEEWLLFATRPVGP